MQMKRAEIGFSISSDFCCFDIPPGPTVEAENFGINSVGLSWSTFLKKNNNWNSHQ